jgi:hypothetical protein
VDDLPAVPSLADPFAAPALREQGPDRPAGHGKADQSLGVATDQRNSGTGPPQRPLERHVKDEQQG